MRIVYLSERPGLLPALASAQYAAFASLLPHWSEAQARDELRTHTGTRTIPTTLIALDDEGDDWLGTVGLLQNDHDRIRSYSPWLASLVVREQVRGRGIGAALVARCVDEAAALGVPALYLYCDESLVPYYRRLGWHDVDRVCIGAVAGEGAVVVMAIEPSRQEHAT